MKFKKINLKKMWKNRKRINFTNSVTLYLSGYNLERWLNILTTKGICLLGVMKKDVKNSEIEILAKDKKFVIAFLKGKNIQITNERYNGIAKLSKFFSVRYGILIAIFLAFSFWVVASNYVWKIQIMGNAKRSTDEIISVLSQNGVNVFNALNEKSNEDIEKIVLENFSEVSMVSVVKKGTSIIINIKEKVISEEYENIETYSALIAKNDGIITDIKLIQGTLLIKIGDTVRTGDKLVAPYVIDSDGNKISIEPKAEVYADVWLTGESVHYDSKEITERTGQTQIERKLSFLNQEIFTKKSEITFEDYEIEMNEEYLADYLLPIKYVTITYYEMTTKRINQSFSEAAQTKIQEAKTLALMGICEGEQIKSENHIITTDNGKTIVSYVVVVNRLI